MGLGIETCDGVTQVSLPSYVCHRSATACNFIGARFERWNYAVCPVWLRAAAKGQCIYTYLIIADVYPILDTCSGTAIKIRVVFVMHCWSSLLCVAFCLFLARSPICHSHVLSLARFCRHRWYCWYRIARTRVHQTECVLCASLVCGWHVTKAL